MSFSECKETNQVYNTLEKNLAMIELEFRGNSDLVIRKFSIGEQQQENVAVIYFDGLVNGQLVNEFISHALSIELVHEDTLNKLADKDTYDLVKEVALTVGKFELTVIWEDVFSSVLSGNTVVLINDCFKALICHTAAHDFRAIAEPTTQTVVRGPKDCFIESIDANIVLIRRRIRNPKLRMEKHCIGSVSRTNVAMMYIEDTENEQLVKEVRRRLLQIDIEGVLESNSIECLIQDKAFSPFPTLLNSERPDEVSSKLLEKKVAILVDGTPFVLITHVTFFDFFKSPEDYSQRFDISTFMRVLRYVAFFITLLSTSIFVALITYHQDIIPTNLLISIATQRERVPFPAVVEALMMEISFEIIREAGIRIPRAVGPTISIVGALVVGEAAVSAGLISHGMIIVVALSAISSYMIPIYNMAASVRLIRFGFLILAAITGFYGIALGLLILAAHLCSLRPFGTYYMSPFAPFYLSRQQDTILRFPFSLLENKLKEPEKDVQHKKRTG